MIDNGGCSCLTFPTPPTVCPTPPASPLAVPLTSPREIAPAVFLPVFARSPTAPWAVPATFLPAPLTVPVAPLTAPPAVFETGAVLPPVAWSSLSEAQNQRSCCVRCLVCCLPSARKEQWQPLTDLVLACREVHPPRHWYRRTCCAANTLVHGASSCVDTLGGCASSSSSGFLGSACCSA